MPKIPFQTQQVAAQTIRNPRASVEASTAPWRALSGAGRQLQQVGKQVSDYTERKNAEVTGAQVNMAYAELQEREKLADEELRILSSTGEPDSNASVDEFYQAKEKQDAEWFESLNLNDAAKAIMQDKFDVSNIRSGTKTYGNGGYVDKAEINFAISTSTAGMLAAEQGKGGVNPITGELETYQESWERNAKKKVELDPSYTQEDYVDERSNLESRRSYWDITETMGAIKEQEANGVLTGQEAIEQYMGIRDSLSDQPLNVDSEAQINATLSARISNGTFAYNKARDKASKAAVKSVEDGDFGIEDIDAIEKSYGKNRAADIIYGLVQAKAPSDKDVMKTLKYLDGFISGGEEYNIDGLFKAAKGADASTAQACLYFANDRITKLEQDKGSVAAYETYSPTKNWRGMTTKSIQVDKNASQFIRASLFYSARAGDEGDISATVNSKMKAFVKWNEKPASDRDDDEKTFDQFFQKTFATDATQFILSPSSPIQKADEEILNDIWGE